MPILEQYKSFPDLNIFLWIAGHPTSEMHKIPKNSIY